MNRKIFGLLIIFLGILVILGMVYLMFFSDDYPLSDLIAKFKKAGLPAAVVNEPVSGQPAGQIATEPAVKKIVFNKQEIQAKIIEEKSRAVPFSKDDLMRMASSFAERFGSYSNHSNFSNIADLKIFMSANMQKRMDSYVAMQRKKDPDKDIYYSITTKAIAEEIRQLDDDLGKAAVLVKTRRSEATGSTSNIANAYNQDIIINFIKESNSWKIDSAYWDEK